MPRRKKDKPASAGRKFFYVKWNLTGLEDLSHFRTVSAAVAGVRVAKANKKYWVHTETVECMLCGRTTVHKERHFSPKPKHEQDRYTYVQSWCRCNP
jgi:hypothetical protein